MIDQTKVKSGFDVEFLMTAEYIRYILLCSFETGSIPWYSISVDRDENDDPIRENATILHPPRELEEKRLYEVHPDFVSNEHPFQDLVEVVYSNQDEEFRVTILPDTEQGADIQLRLFPSIIEGIDTDNPTPLVTNLLPLDMDIKFELDSDTTGDGLLENVGLRLTLLDISGALIDAAEAFPNFSKEKTLADLKAQIDRKVDFGLAGGGALQNIQIQKFIEITDTPNAIGVYINLALQNGPERSSILPDRGDHLLGENFLPTDAKMAFAFSAATYQNLADDFKFKMAELKEDSETEFHFPLKDNDGEITGKIKGIEVYPETIDSNNAPPVFTNVLVIDIELEYFIDDFFDPDFHFKIRLIPVVKDGVFDFDVDFDLDLSLLAKIVVTFLSIVTFVIIPQIGLPLLFSSLLIIKIIEETGEAVAAPIVKSEIERTSFLDTLPHKLIVEQRRWDPLFDTLHRVETGNATLQVNTQGFAFAASDLFVGRKHQPVDHVVIRSETRDDAGVVNGLIYRAKDIQSLLNTDLSFVFPATFRLPFLERLPPTPGGGVETHRVVLTMEQIEERQALEGAYLFNIPYFPKKVDIKENQIYQILTLAEREGPEIIKQTKDRLKLEIDILQEVELQQQAFAELQEELGRDPTDVEFSIRFERLKIAAFDDAIDSRIELELNLHMRFDLEPFEFANLERKGILMLGRNHLIIVDMKRDDKIITYYRDFEFPFEKGVDQTDNLLALPRYSAEDLNS